MPYLDTPPSRSDDGAWIDGLDEADCTICGEALSAEELERLNDEEGSNDDKLASALCGKCQREEDGDDEENDS